MCDMREKVIHRILHQASMMSAGEMRWSNYWFFPEVGVCIAGLTRKQRKNIQNLKHTSEITREDLDALDDERLLTSFEMLTRQATRQYG